MLILRAVRLGASDRNIASTTKRRRRTAAIPHAIAIPLQPRQLLLLLFGCVLLVPTGHGWVPLTSSPHKARERHLENYSATRIAAKATAISSAASTGPAVVDLPWSEFSPAESASAAAPVVFLHGLLGSKRNFATLAKSLHKQLETPRRILGVDLRNHGDNAPDQWQDDMSYENMSLDVIQFLDQQKLESVVLVGHSMGGKVAQMIALRHSHRVEGLVVLDMAPVSYAASEPHWKAVTEIIHTLQSLPVGEGTTKQTVDRHLSAVIPDPALRAFCLTNWNHRTGQWAIPVDKIAAQLDRLAEFNVPGNGDDDTIVNGHNENESGSNTSTPPQYEGDVFFIHGGQSKFVRATHMETIAQYFPNHMLTTIRGAGHWVHAEAPDDTIALLKRYLDR